MFKKSGISFLMLLVLFILIFNSCSQIAPYPLPSKKQIDYFIQENNITPLDIKNTNKFTVVLFENDNLQGYYILSVDNKNKLQSRRVAKSFNKGQLNLNTISVEGVPEETAFVTVIINEDSYIPRAHKIEIKMPNGVKVTEKVKGKGTIVLCPGKKSEKSIEVILYDNEMHNFYVGGGSFTTKEGIQQSSDKRE
jgi:hypothetical protein